MSTFRDFLNELAGLEGTSFDDWDEDQIKLRVAKINEAVRREWKTEDPLFAFPETVATATVTVTSGKISPSDLGDQTWCALFETDPRAAGASFRPIKARVSNTGVHPVNTYTSVFAFYRATVPQGTYAQGGAYATPSGIPSIFLDTVPVRALASIYVAMGQFDSLNALLKLHGEPGKIREARIAALRESNLIWDGYELALTPAAA